ncbi:MAG: biotin--[acetyl-CoA-carboxylase] ligase [Lachnospiraceae bacterium]|nr:biotin--[acetyl-CoA-carboxylase] ligase [Lachnospiraceae bacterium]
MATKRSRRNEAESSLCTCLRRNPLVQSVIELEEIDSTNRVGKGLAAEGAPEGTLVVAKRQSKGKGRLGRSFFSPEGGIYMSMVLRPKIPAEKALLVTTCAAVAVARAIERVSNVTAGIKWVNDIFVNGRKVCGILAEAGLSAVSEYPDYVILGIGINVKKQSVPDELKDIVGCLEDTTEREILNEELIFAVWEEFEKFYGQLSTAVFMEEYKSRSILLGREVTVLAATGDYRAVVTDIDKDGHLVIKREDKSEILSSGEVSVRL